MVLNGCRTNDLGDAFERAGVKCVVHTAKGIGESQFHKFALDLYTELHYGQTVGVAMRVASTGHADGAFRCVGDKTVVLSPSLLSRVPKALVSVNLCQYSGDGI